MVAENIYQVIGNYFLLPEGLIALTALIPLLIFYLIRKKPEREIMPSYMFFQDGEKSGSASQAIQTLLRNLILLFHILLVFGIAAAIAEPYIDAGASPEHSVLVLDQSASMEGDFQDAKNFLKSNTGNKNTVILVTDNRQVVAEKTSAGRASRIIDNAELKDTETDIVSGIRASHRYEGNVFIASDLTQSTSSEDVEDAIQTLRQNNIPFEVMDTERRNAWGVIDIEVGEGTTQVDVKNFQDRRNSFEIEANGENREITVPGNSVETVSVESQPGRNTVQLENDGFEADNSAYFYLPEGEDYSVAHITDDRNRYLEKVFELIEFTSIETVNPPLDRDLDSDIYIIGETDRILSETVGEIESELESGKPVILFGNQDFQDMGFQNLPVEARDGYRETSVTVTDPVRASIGDVEVRNVKKTRGESYSNRENVLVRSTYRNGEFFFYNLDDRVFRQQFTYPIFWKSLTEEMTGRPGIDQLNRETGEEINRSSITTPDGEELSGNHRLEKTGFYETSGGTVAVNLLSEEESYRNTIETDSSSTAGKSERNVQNLASLLLVLLVLGELIYLYRIGDLQ